ncbi:MAG TPA: hypothetical protein PKH37_04345 [Alphaproteobacteria bacterium]|nr:hypothetical protein [Alphaproteobacteria bacterium]
MISDRDIIRVHLSLELPQAIAELMDRGTPLLDDEYYALEVGLSEMTPEKCLLSLACTARYVALEKSFDEAMKVSLSLQADSAFDDYAPRYLAGLKHSMKATCSGYPIYMQEDLESFADLFSLVADLSGASGSLRDIALILSDQAAAHAEAIGLEEDLFDYDQNMLDLEPGHDAPPPPLVAGGNVILFPRSFRK